MSTPEEPEQSGQQHHPHIKRYALAPTFEGADAPDETGFETIVGLVGDSPRPSSLRVYTDLSFLSYCEIYTSDIAQAAPVDPADDRGPTIVRMRAGARIEYVRVDRLAGDASYVFGEIRAMYYGRSAAGEPVQYAANQGNLPDKYAPAQAWPGPPPPITPVLYCLSQVYPPC